MSRARYMLGKVALFMLLSFGMVAASQAASLSFNPNTVQLEPGESAFVEVVATDVPASGLAAFQFDIQFDPAQITIVDPNRTFAGAVPAYVPLGNNPFCATVRGTACTDSDWMLITSNRTPLADIREQAGKVSILYGTSGSDNPPSGTGVIALIEVVGVADSTSTVDFSNAIIADNDNPPQAHPLTFESLAVQIGQPVNQQPTLTAITDVTLDEGDVTAVVLDGNDPDPGDTLTYSTTPLPGFVTLNGDTLDIAPNFDDAGFYPVTATVSDGLLDASRSFTIEVVNFNRPPTLSPIADVTINIGETTDVVLNGVDPDAGTILIFGATVPDFVTLNGNTLTIEPGLDDAGFYPASANVSDGFLSDSETFSIEVFDVTPPVVDITDPVDGLVTSSTTVDVSGSVDDDTATVSVNGVPATVVGGAYSATGVPLVEGSNTLTALAVDPVGNSASVSITVIRD
ncbi:MAG: hypothetical protein GY815_10910, partial [Gammaproteobacteria bacterium]|nr:hypothetical protein [Gammaproteobacteria bacterium]